MTTITIKIDHDDPDVKVNVHRVEVKSDDPDRFVHELAGRFAGVVRENIDRPTVQRSAERGGPVEYCGPDGLAGGIEELSAARDRALMARDEAARATADAINERNAAFVERDAERARAKELSDRLGARLAERGDLLAGKDQIVGDLKAAKERADQLYKERASLRQSIEHRDRQIATMGAAADRATSLEKQLDMARSRLAGLEAVAADANVRASNNWTDARNAEDELRKVRRLRDVDAPVIAEVIKWDALTLPDTVNQAIAERAKALAAIADEDIPF